MPLTFEKHDPEHQRLWDTMKITRDAASLQRVSDKIKLHREIYEKVQKDTGVPWQLVAVIHLREAGEQDIGKFQRGIHNGQSWKIKATIIPKIGPFTSWHACALAALKRTGLTEVGAGNWTPAKMLSAAEPYNGYGYRNKGLRSPYLWASTNHQQPGKYVSDGVFSRTVIDNQVGVAAQLKYLGVGQKTSAVADKTVVTGKDVAKGTGFLAVFAGIVAAAWQWGTEHPLLVGGGVALLIFGYLTYTTITETKEQQKKINQEKETKDV